MTKRLLVAAALVLACDRPQAEVGETAAPPSPDAVSAAAEALTHDERHRRNQEAAAAYFARLPQSSDFVWHAEAVSKDFAARAHSEWVGAVGLEELVAAYTFMSTLSRTSVDWQSVNQIIIPDVRDVLQIGVVGHDGAPIREFVLNPGRRGFVAAAGCTSSGERAIAWDYEIRSGTKWPYYIAYIRQHEIAHHADPRQISCEPIEYATFRGLEVGTHCETARRFVADMDADEVQYFFMYAAGLADEWTQEILADEDRRVEICGT